MFILIVNRGLAKSEISSLNVHNGMTRILYMRASYHSFSIVKIKYVQPLCVLRKTNICHKINGFLGKQRLDIWYHNFSQTSAVQ